MHGSINWFKFRSKNGDWSSESIGIPLDSDIWHTKDPRGEMQWLKEGRPIFLVGTFNKMLDYTSGIYEEVHYQLYRSLRRATQLVICGYGFGDKGINTRIIEWIYSSSACRVIVIHPEPEKLKNYARGSIRNKWDKWINNGKLTIIEKTIEKTSWQDLKDTLLKDFK